MLSAEYIRQALRTESRVDEVRLNRNHTRVYLREAIAAGQHVDELKKRAFYGAASPWGGMNEDPLHGHPRLIHAIFGIFTEAAELLESLKNVALDGHELDETNVAEEVGDLFWYLAILFDHLGLDPAAVMEANIRKLKARYPENFTATAALTRDLAAERVALEAE